MDLALFDFDGTITTGDTYTPFLSYATPRRFRRRAWRKLLWPWLGYKLRLISGPAVRRRVTAHVLAGREHAAIRALGERYARERLPRVLRPEAMARIAWHRARGDCIVVVSASLDAYLVPWCRAHGLELICSELDADGVHLTGGYRGGDCTGPAKAARVLERFPLHAYARVHAYGDTVEDREMLALAHHPVYRWQIPAAA
ncbi:HAD-IB family hydrolase [Dyella sp.]|jgi:HAD superfamily hydrolase (TIGR01490 family)|uniref:HAD-IB family hydrolase n=1 Tax=Dyella sp. TaxID=1869338 RepID=UPI002D78ED8E|nr:HAD-IB family hydrolase [Dyella sp.]HET6432836.1 HAD-IB family hydrolase [Dyella sp.]